VLGKSGTHHGRGIQFKTMTDFFQWKGQNSCCPVGNVKRKMPMQYVDGYM